MSVTINARGTSVPYFGIGKGGITLYQGIENPTIIHTIRNGDYWLDSSNNSLRVYSGTDWGAPRLDNITFLDTTISSIDNDLILNPPADKAVVVNTNGENGLITTDSGLDLIIDPSEGGGGKLKLGPLFWPLVDGTVGQVLATTGTGTLIWSDAVPAALNNLTDVVITNPVPGQYLRYTDGTVGWENASIESGVTSVGVIGNNGILVANSPVTGSGNISLDLGAITPGSVSTNLITMTGVGARISGDFSSVSPDTLNRLMFQSSVPNGVTIITAIPNGTGTSSQIGVLTASDALNASSASLVVSSGTAIARLESSRTGTAPYLPLALRTSGIDALTLDINGDVTVNRSGARIKADFSNATLTNRVSFQTTVGNSSTNIQILPAGTSFTSQLQLFDNSDPTNASYIGLYAFGTTRRLVSGITGSGTYYPLDVWTGGAVSLSVGTNGDVTISKAGARIRGDFSHATLSNRLAFQTTTPDSHTVVGVVPSGTSKTSALIVNGSSDVNNTPYGGLISYPTVIQLEAGKTGTGAYLPLQFHAGGLARMTIGVDGTITYNVPSGDGTGSHVTQWNNPGVTGTFASMIAYDLGHPTNAGAIEWRSDKGNKWTNMSGTTTRMFISYQGDWSVNKVGNTLSQSGLSYTYGNSTFQVVGGGQFASPLIVNNPFVGASTLTTFHSNSVQVGAITTTGTTVAYTSTSDYRLKDVIGPLTGSGAFIDSLEPIEFTWKSTGAAAKGFLAHRLQEVCPSAVFGLKDALDDEGNIAPQLVETASAEMIANLVAELQSCRQRIAALEAAIAVL